VIDLLLSVVFYDRWRSFVAVALTVMAMSNGWAQTITSSANSSAGATTEPSVLYQEHCASCHGTQRTGLMGPALLPESLERLRKNDALKVITQGRMATQMPAFASSLSEADIAALAKWIYSPVSPSPQWLDATFDNRACKLKPHLLI